MSTFFKKIATIQRLRFGLERLGTSTLTPNLTGATMEFVGPKTPGYGGSNIQVKIGTTFSSSLGFATKDERTITMTPPNSAITVGLAALGGITILAAQTLPASGTTTISTGFTQPDYPRSLQFVTNNAACGNGTFFGASARWVTVTGVNQFNNTVTESVPLNGTTAVLSIQCFLSISSIQFPAYVSVGDTCTTTVGSKLALERPVQQAADFIEAARKATAATAYTIEALSGIATADVGEAWARSTVALPNILAANNSAPIQTTVTFNNTLISGLGGAFPTTFPYLLEIINPGPLPGGAITTSNLETVTVTASATVGSVTTLTIVRGVHGLSGIALPAHNLGVYLNWKPGQGIILTTLTANDRYLLKYRSSWE